MTVCLYTLSLLLLALSQRQEPVFRAGVDAVVVDAAVLKDGATVKGLAKEQFELRDNGVPQTIVDMSVDTMPLDIVALVDVSRSTDDWRVSSRSDLSRVIEAMRAALHPDDRLEVATVASVLRMPGGATGFGAPSGENAQLTALLDAVTVLSIRGGVPARRRLIVAITDGMDNASVIGPAARQAALGRAEATLYFVLDVKAHEQGLFGNIGAQGMYEFFRSRLDGIAQLAGGRAFDVRPGGRLDDVVNAVLRSHRERYLLRYVPSSRAPGWHQIDLTVRGVRDVTFRKGYWQPDPPGRD